MPTLGDLKTRLIAETNRDDLATGEALEAVLASCISQASEHFAGEDFWFTRASGSRSTTASVDLVALPDEVRVAEVVVCDGERLLKVLPATLAAAVAAGKPTQWAAIGDNIQLWPVPDGSYSLDIFGLARIDPPASDGESGIWTNEAYDLIAARTRFLLFRDVFRDVEGTQLAAQAEGEALGRLRRETRRRAVISLRSTGDEPWTAQTGSFSVNRGY
jgi:hypothetical protein